MELKAGYKQTEVGVIPEDWAIRSIAEVSRKIMDYRGRTPKKLGLDWGDGDIPALSAANVKLGYIDFELECYLASETLYRRWMVHGDVEKNDIVFTTEAPLGNVALIPDSRKYVLSQRTVLFQSNEKTTHSPFLYQVLMSAAFQQTLQDNASGSTAQGIKRRVLETLLTVSPPVAEQRAIAEALSDADALIESLDQLITKKRNLKQAAMQQLLTGQTRLPGFSGEWGETTLGEIGDCIIGLTYHPGNVVAHGLLVLRSSNVQGGRLAFYDNVYVDVEVSERIVTRPGDILICVRNGSRALIGKSSVIDDRAAGVTFGAFMTVFRTNHWRFVSYAFQSDDIQRQIRDNIGATINQITNKDMKALQLRLPGAVEQTAIATILGDMDTELAELESRLAKAHHIKQGMMQELLTGKIRLIRPTNDTQANAAF